MRCSTTKKHKDERQFYAFTVSMIYLFIARIDQNSHHSKKANFNRNSLFYRCISINLYLSSSARYLRCTERLYGQMRRILL